MHTKRLLSLDDAVDCARLIDECGELGTDSTAWQEHLATGYAQMIGGCMSLVVCGPLRDRTPTLGTACFARHTDSKIRGLFSSYRSAGGLGLLPEYAVIAPVALSHQQLTYRQSSIVPRREYYRSQFYQDFMAAERLEDFISSTHFYPEIRQVIGLSIHRHKGDRGFTRRDEAVSALLIRLVSERFGSSLLSAAQTGRENLSPRRQQVYDLLLQGAPDKVIARSLGISTATAHEHVLHVLRHFGVRSRVRLLSRRLHEARR